MATASSRIDGQRRPALLALSPMLSGALLLLMPKCPLCVAGLLAGLGAGAGTAALLAPWLKPLLFGWLVLSLLALVIFRAGRHRGKAPAASRRPACCRDAARASGII